MNLDMEKKGVAEMLQGPDFTKWHPQGLIGDHSFDIGAISYGTDGELVVDIHDAPRNTHGKLAFSAPLAIRVVGEGSLMDYWNSGFSVAGHSLFIARRSSFLEWLEQSSSGVHSLRDLAHYAAFSDDVCIEVLTREIPVFRPSRV